jgi:hypothetical protein
MATRKASKEAARKRAGNRPRAIVGVSDHAGWAVLVTIATPRQLIDRRRIELIEEGLPKLAYHHDCQALPEAEGVRLIERVSASADRCARESLDALAQAVRVEIEGIAIRKCPPLPPTIAGRIADYRAQCVSDTVLCRDAVAGAAVARGWRVYEYEVKSVLAEGASVLALDSLDDLLAETGRSQGRPWTKDHRVAMAAAIAARGSLQPWSSPGVGGSA